MPDDRLLVVPNAAIQQNPRIGVFAHIFYPDLCEEMLTACNHIPGNCRVFISTDTLIKAKEISVYCEQFSKHPFEIRVLPNRGRDIAPMICGYRDRINEVDYGVHIHSKRSSHFRSSFADGWRKHGIYGNLGSTELVQNILTVLADERIGAYAPDHYEAIRPAVQWTGNFSTVKQLLELAGEDISKDHHLDFPSGSMFWFKTKALKPLLDLKLRPFHFEAEQGQTDNTLAHALERSLFYFVEIAGFAWIMGKRVSGAAAADSVLMLQAPGFNLNHVANRIFPTNKELGGLRRYFGNCTRFLARPSLITKPRINLLLPTLNQGQGHIDIDSALALFNAIKHALGDGVDARIITTDVSPEQLFNPPEGYQLTTPHDKDQAGVNNIADAAQRFRFPFFVRKTDIFIATAWWTATHALDLLSQQDALFGVQTRQFVYFIQDVEHSYYPWSSLSTWAEQSYKHPDKIIPVFQTEMVSDYFRQHDYFNHGYVVYPAMNLAIKSAITYQANKEKLVLLLVRPHIERFNTPFIDVMIRTAIDADPVFWSDWRFIALGDHISATTFKTAIEVDVIGEVSPQQYAGLASKAALGVALMASPQPSYTALELAEAGVLVLTNAYANKNMALLHDNITSFEKFDVVDASQQLKRMAEHWLTNPTQGWQGQAHINWFYDNAAITTAKAAEIAKEIQAKLIQ
ncbi:rhamnosyltransferase WsaF family glycosyltransferase [Methylocucumis oryzae]|uniref:Uncharacterized protein n=1 Tax=Methylocucumis oryzae TaxID=1632867 RepID=A0A0F3IND2_9GAMM|nr:rhamnan synthesis F family protein [Methylocucumis oryzae]KJV07054.1 hypothetical protein VZ94_07280 [Methylocucumis oryzae]